MVIGIGTDIVEISRIQSSIEKLGDAFLNKIYTASEQKYCLERASKFQHFAARFAAKEAVAKALYQAGAHNVSWLDIEVQNNSKGVPSVILHNEMLENFGNYVLKISISHSTDNAICYALLQTNEK